MAETFRARIVKTEGDVYVINSAGMTRLPQKKQNLVSESETIVTSKNSKAIVQFEDGVMSVMDEKSSLLVEQSGWLSQLSGKIYYVFRKLASRDKSRKIKTKFATIGIRGTIFIVDATGDNQKLALRKGKLNIESPDGEYELLKDKSVADDYATFKQQAVQAGKNMHDEFTDYKESINDEFVEYKKSFNLEENKVLSFHGRRVNKSNIDKSWESAFKGYSDYSIEYIDAYDELDVSGR